jgi:hypothetical protein
LNQQFLADEFSRSAATYFQIIRSCYWEKWKEKDHQTDNHSVHIFIYKMEESSAKIFAHHHHSMPSFYYLATAIHPS